MAVKRKRKATLLEDDFNTKIRAKKDLKYFVIGQKSAFAMFRKR